MAGKRPVPPEHKARMKAARTLLKEGKAAEAATAFSGIAAEAESHKRRGPAIRAHMAATGAFMRAKDHDAAQASLDKAIALVKAAKKPERMAKGLAVFVGRLRKNGRDKAADFIQQRAEGALGTPLPAVGAGDEDGD